MGLSFLLMRYGSGFKPGCLFFSSLFFFFLFGIHANMCATSFKIDLGPRGKESKMEERYHGSKTNNKIVHKTTQPTNRKKMGNKTPPKPRGALMTTFMIIDYPKFNLSLFFVSFFSCCLLSHLCTCMIIYIRHDSLSLEDCKRTRVWDMYYQKGSKRCASNILCIDLDGHEADEIVKNESSGTWSNQLCKAESSKRDQYVHVYSSPYQSLFLCVCVVSVFPHEIVCPSMKRYCTALTHRSLESARLLSLHHSGGRPQRLPPLPFAVAHRTLAQDDGQSGWARDSTVNRQSTRLWKSIVLFHPVSTHGTLCTSVDTILG